MPGSFGPGACAFSSHLPERSRLAPGRLCSLLFPTAQRGCRTPLARGGGDDLERGAASIADQALATRRPSVDRRRTSVGAPFSARMWGPPSTHARDESRSPAAFRPAATAPGAANRSARNRIPAPAAGVARSMSLCRTYRMPCGHSRSATGRAPGDFSGQGGSSGSVSAHKSSSTIHGRVLRSSRTGGSAHRSRRTRALQQDQITSSQETRSDTATVSGVTGCQAVRRPGLRRGSW